MLYDGKDLHYKVACWADHYQDESSNFREAENLVARMEAVVRTRGLQQQELFIITDEMVFKGTFYRRHLDSRKLNDPVFRVKNLERQEEMILHMVHIAGMKASGVDGLSWGNLIEGVMARADPLKFILLEWGPVKRLAGAVEQWIGSW